MRRNKFPAMAIATGVAALLLLPACSVNVQKERNGQDKQVDIETPVGGIHVNKQGDVSDVGLAVYPGARPKEKDSDGSDKSANVNISGFGYGLKVVAVEEIRQRARMPHFQRELEREHGKEGFERVDLRRQRRQRHRA